MAKEETPQPPQASEEEWETVAEESGSPILFEEIGAQFIGVYIGRQDITPSDDPEDAFVQLKFRDSDDNVRTINAGYKLLDAFAGIGEGQKVRITRTPDVPMNDPKKNDMKDYRVDVAR